MNKSGLGQNRKPKLKKKNLIAKGKKIKLSVLQTFARNFKMWPNLYIFKIFAIIIFLTT